MRRSHFSAVVRGILQNSSSYLTVCLFLRSTWTRVSGGLMSGWSWTQLTGAENQRNGNSLRACTKRKRTFRKTGLSSTPPHRSRASLTRSFVKATQITHCRALCTRRVLGAPSLTEQCCVREASHVDATTGRG